MNIVTNAAPGVWHHFAVVRSGIKMSLYLNGALAGDDSAFTLAINQTFPLIFGGHTDTSATYAPRWFDGKLDELAVFSAALSPAAITTLANGMTVRHFGGLSATGTITLSAAPVTNGWTSATTNIAQMWSTGANWAGNSVPSGGRSTMLQFFTGQTLAGGAITASNNIAGGFVLNSLTLAGTASAATTATVTGGGLTFLNNGLFNPTVMLNATAGSGFTYDIATPLTLGADTTFGGSGTATSRFSGMIDGAGALIKTSTGTLTLTGSNTYSGDTLISAGTLQIGADGATGSLGTGAVTDSSQLRFDRTGTLLVPNSITGTGNLYIDCPISAGTIVLSGTNSFTGGVTVNSGALRITSAAALGTGAKTITLSNGTLGAPQLRLDGSNSPIELPRTISFTTSSNTGALINEAGSNTVNGDITLTGGGGDTKILVDSGVLTMKGAVAPNTTLRNLQLSGAGDGIITGVISNGVGVNTLNVAKNDAGTWLLAGTNTYTGTTTINAGTLLLGNTSALGNGGANIGNNSGGSSVIAGATLDLNGQTGVNEVLTVRGTGVGSLGCLVNNSATPASIAGGVLSSVAVTAGGTHSVVPTVMFSGPGSGAAAAATLGVTAASFTIAGGTTAYSAAPTVTVSGGGGSGATATAVLTNGIVSGITVTTAGAGYTNAPTLAFSGGTISSSGTNPTGAGNAANFTVSGVTVTNPGSGYPSAPTVSFGSGTGTAATAYLSSVIMGANTSFGGTGDTLLDAPVSGGYALTKIGAGTLTLNGTNTFTGGTTISAGKLVLRSCLTNSVAVTTGTLAPSGAPTITGNVAINSGGRFAVQLNGPAAGIQYDQLTVSGTVTLAGALDIAASTNLPPGSTFTIINNTGAGAVSGTFLGKPNNSAFSTNGYNWRISYNGGTGNDVTLSLYSIPTISDVPNQTVYQNTPTAAIPFIVGDAETAADALTVSGSSSNTALVPNGNIVFGGSGSNRTVTVTPALNQLGTANITLTVSDGTDIASDTFVLTVTAMSVWTNTATGSTLAWAAGTNWLAGTPALSSAGGTVEFLTGQTLSAGTITVSNDNAGAFQLATLRLAGAGPASGIATVALGGNALSLTGGGVTPTVRLDASAGSGGLIYSLSNAIALTESTVVQGTGTASFVIGGTVTGAGDLTKSGTASLTLSGANTYSGGTTLSSSSGVVRATVSVSQSGVGSGPVMIGAGSMLLLDNINTSAAAVLKANTFAGFGLLKLSFATNATARTTALPGLSGFAGTVQLSSSGSSGDKLDAGGVTAPNATVQIDSGSTLVVSNTPATFSSIAVSGTGNSEGRGAIRMATGTALAGTVSLLGDTLIASDAAGATISGNISGSASAGATNTLIQGTAASPAGCILSGAISDGSAGGKVALTQLKGTLILSGANTYSGATTVSGGTLQVGALNTLPTAGSVTLGTTSGAGNLALSSFSQTLASLAVASTNAALTNVVSVAPGQTLTVTGMGGLLVGTDSGTNSVTLSKMTGGGTLVVTNASAYVTVGKAQASQNYSSSGTLDCSGLSCVTLGSSAAAINELRVGYGLTCTGLLTLSDTNNTITATALQIGNSNSGNGGVGTVILGTGSNVISANTVNIGLSKTSGTLKFASQALGSPGTVSIGGKTGTSADFLIGGKIGTGTSATPIGTLDLRGHLATVAAGSVTLGKEDSTTTNYNGGTTGYLYFDGGTFTASNLTMAAKSGISTGAATAALTVSGGVFTVTSGGSFSLASQSGGGSASGTLNVNGGLFVCNADIRDGGSNSASTVSLNGGTLNMTGHMIGPASQRVDVVTFRSGTLINLGQLNSGAPLVKTGGGTLSLAGTNTYSGTTVVSNGTLRLVSAVCLPPATEVYLVTGATNQLDYAGTQTVHAVYINGKPKTSGVYGQGNLSPYLSGTGYLKTEWPPSVRTLFMLR